MADPRKPLNLTEKNEVLRMQATCSWCGRILGMAEPVHYDHVDFHALGGSRGPENHVAMHESCHEEKTNGVKHIPRSGDKTKIAHVKHLRASDDEHHAKMRAKLTGIAPPEPKRKAKIPSRPFPKRKQEK